MDVRQLRSSQSLRAAVLEAVRKRPIELVTVAEVARAAGVTRATFYNHAQSPAGLLADLLRVELAEVSAEFRSRIGRDETDLRMLFAAHIRLTMVYLSTRAEVFAVDASARLSPLIYGLLVDHLGSALHDYLSNNGVPVPTAESGGGDLAERALLANLAHGAVGGIEVWLGTAEPRDLDQFVETSLYAIPSWWFSARLPS